MMMELTNHQLKLHYGMVKTILRLLEERNYQIHSSPFPLNKFHLVTMKDLDRRIETLIAKEKLYEKRSIVDKKKKAKKDPNELTDSQYSMIVHWMLYHCQISFEFQTETFLRSVEIFNRFLSLVLVPYNFAFFTAMACLYIASKVEEEEERIFTTTQFVAATNMPTMQIQDMCRVELLICKRLKFNINSPTSIQYIIPILLKTNRLLLNEYELMNDSLRDLLDEKSENFLKLFHNIELLIVKCALLPLMNSFNPLTVAMCCISFVPEYVDRLSDPHQSGNWLIFLVKLLKEYSVDFIKFIQCRKCLMKRIPNIIYFIFSAKNGVLMINDEMLNKYHHHHHHHHPEHENLKTIVENKKSENFENEINNTKIHKINMNTTTTTTTTSANINSRRIMRSFRKRYQKKKKNKSMGNNSTIPLMLNEKKSSWNQFPLDDDDESSSNTISNTTINQTILPSIQEQQQQQSWKRLRTITNESLGQQTIDDSIDTGELNDIYDAKILKIADLTLISSTLEQENHHINTPCKMEHNHDIGTYAEVLTRNYKNHTKV